jgi:NADH-quinone oxidoreductase subunit G
MPGAASMPAWLTLAQFSDVQVKLETETPAAFYYQWLADIIPELTDANLTTDIPDEGVRLNSGVSTDLRFTSEFAGQTQEHRGSNGNLKIVLSDLTFGTELLSARSECLRELEPEPAVIMHTSEAHRLDLVSGDSVCIQTERGNFKVKLKVVENMAAGVLVVPRHRRISWQVFETGVSRIGRDQIQKVTA